MHSTDRYDASPRGRRFAVAGSMAAIALAVAWWPGGSHRPPSHHAVLDGVSIAWPSLGESAIAVNGDPQRFSRPASEPVPIASVAKVMTAYLVLRKFPLSPTGTGFTMAMSEA